MIISVFLAIGDNFFDYRQKGQEELMINYHLKNYSRNFEKVDVYSYANESLHLFNNVRVFPNKYNLHRYIYCFLIPIIYFRQISMSGIIRSFQITGGIPGIIAQVIHQKKFIVNYGYDYVNFALLENKPVRSYVYQLVVKIVLYFAQFIIVTANYLSLALPKDHNSKIYVIPNGVDTNQFKPDLKAKKNLILFVGRLEPQKNLFTLIDAVKNASVGSKELLFIGSGSLKSELLLFAKKIKVNLSIIDSINHSSLPKYYNKALLFVLPSLDEGQPKVLLEAMSCGVPVLVSDIPAHREIVTHKITGLISENKPEILAKYIKELMKKPSYRRLLGTNARNLISKRYSMRILNKQEISLLKKVDEN
jgi:glycosyltransferase involved in cell wall biosynthesis